MHKLSFASMIMIMIMIMIVIMIIIITRRLIAVSVGCISLYVTLFANSLRAAVKFECALKF